MSEQTNAAAERSAHVTRGGGVVPAEWPVVQLPDGTWQLKAVAERDAEIEKLRAALRVAMDAVEYWASYASLYAHEKHDLAGDLQELRAALGEKE